MTKFTKEQQKLLEEIIDFREDGKFDVGGINIGHVDGNVHGDVWGDVKGNVHGDVKRSVEGSVEGSVCGDVDGNVHGSVWGDVGGDVNGSVEGDVKGNVKGTIWGSGLDDVSERSWFKVETKDDPVNAPDHYQPKDGEIECITYIESALGSEKFVGYCQGNVTKYLHRHAYKGKPVQDLEKAQVYLGWMIKAMKGEKVR